MKVANAAIPLPAWLILFLAVVAGSLWVEVRPFEYDAPMLIGVNESKPSHASSSGPSFHEEIVAAIKEEAGEPPAKLETLFSQGALDPVITRLDLVSAWNLPSMDAARTALTGRIKVEPWPGTDLVRLTVRADTAERAVDLVNALARAWRQHFDRLAHEYLHEKFFPSSTLLKEKVHAMARAKTRVLDFREELDPAMQPHPPLEPETGPAGATRQDHEAASGAFHERLDDFNAYMEGLEKARLAFVCFPRHIDVLEAADTSTVRRRLNVTRREKAPLAAVALGAALLAASVLLGAGVRRLFHEPADRTGR